MRLAVACLAGEERNAECPALNPALQFKPETLVHLRKVHVENLPKAITGN
jgi:hypothetical protein